MFLGIVCDSSFQDLFQNCKFHRTNRFLSQQSNFYYYRSQFIYSQFLFMFGKMVTHCK